MTISARQTAPALHYLASAFLLPWGAFVAAFLYYVLLTLVTIGIDQLPPLFIAGSYLLPVALYAGVLGSRAVHALSNITIDIGPTPELILH